MTPTRLRIEDAEGVRLVTFDRPEARNAFDRHLYAATSGALRDAASDDGVHVVVLTGAGTAFTAGQDLKEMAQIATGQAPEGAESGFRELIGELTSIEKPLLAAVNGVAIGLGFTMLGYVDIVLIDEGARLRAPFAEMGVPPEAGSSALLPARMGWQRAAAVLLASEWLDAGAAVDAGIALRACPEGTVVAETLSLARRMATYPPTAVAGIKRLMRAAAGDAAAEARAREEAAYAALFADPSANPGAALASGLGG